jgi:hypothetical protein
MTEPAPKSRPSRGIRSTFAEAGSYLTSLLISAAAAIWCCSATGPSLGLFLGGLLLATLIAPPFAVWDKPSRIWLPILGITLGIALVWATSLHPADVTTWEWLRCCLVLATFVLALAGIATLLVTIRIPPSPAAGLTILLGLLWLTWPVWLSPWLTQPMADWLVPANPVFAVNATLRHLGTWDRAPLAYRALSTLNQDVPYRLPGSIAPACILHALVGFPTIFYSTRTLHRRPRPSSAPI